MELKCKKVGRVININFGGAGLTSMEKEMEHSETEIIKCNSSLKTTKKCGEKLGSDFFKR